MGPVRLFSGIVFLVVVTALGAVLGFRMTGSERSTTGRTTAASDTAGTGGSSGPAVSAPARVWPMAVSVEVRDAAGRTLLQAPVGATDPLRSAGGGFAPIDPPRWRQAVWARYRPLVRPTDTARGTSYLYGHACHHHACAFTALALARRDGTIVVTGDGRRLVYRITSTSDDYPKVGPGSLAERRDGVANRNVPNRIVLITCAYEQGDVSLNNFVAIGQRVGSGSTP